MEKGQIKIKTTQSLPTKDPQERKEDEGGDEDQLTVYHRLYIDGAQKNKTTNKAKQEKRREEKRREEKRPETTRQHTRQDEIRQDQTRQEQTRAETRPKKRPQDLKLQYQSFQHDHKGRSKGKTKTRQRRDHYNKQR